MRLDFIKLSFFTLQLSSPGIGQSIPEAIYSNDQCHAFVIPSNQELNLVEVVNVTGPKRDL